jgi:uncharacterized protein YkwD
MRRYLILSALLAACAQPSPSLPRPTAALGVPLATAMPTQAAPTPQPSSTPSSTPAPLPTIVPTAATPLPTIVPTSITPPADDAAREGLLLTLVNAERAGVGSALYPLDPQLSGAARAHSCDMATHQFMGHTGSDGRALTDRVPPGLPWQFYSESIAIGTDDPAAVVALWMDEPPDGWHRRNILDADRVVAGIGYCQAPDDPTGNQHYWTMIVAK